MNKAPLKKRLVLLSIILLVFFGAGLIFYLFTIYFPASVKVDKNNLPITNLDFTIKIYPQLLDLGKFFLTILVGVFVASITFSEKIVNFNSSSWWSKSLLVLCWILLLVSIVCDGVGLVFLTNWYANELIEHSQDNMQWFQLAFLCFGLAGICFGLALTSMLTAGIISFISQVNFKSPKSIVKPTPDIPLE